MAARRRILTPAGMKKICSVGQWCRLIARAYLGDVPAGIGKHLRPETQALLNEMMHARRPADVPTSEALCVETAIECTRRQLELLASSATAGGTPLGGSSLHEGFGHLKVLRGSEHLGPEVFRACVAELVVL